MAGAPIYSGSKRQAVSPHAYICPEVYSPLFNLARSDQLTEKKTNKLYGHPHNIAVPQLPQPQLSLHFGTRATTTATLTTLPDNSYRHSYSHNTTDCS
jgi:hypothetical protein